MGMRGDGYGCMHGMSDMERASERKGDGKENGYETMGLMAMGECMG